MGTPPAHIRTVIHEQIKEAIISFVSTSGDSDSGDEYNDGISIPTESEVTLDPATKLFCTFAVHTGLTDSPGIPLELRLSIYEAAFPETDRSIVEEETGEIVRSQLVRIRDGFFCWCHPDGSVRKDHQEDLKCSCGSYEMRVCDPFEQPSGATLHAIQKHALSSYLHTLEKSSFIGTRPMAMTILKEFYRCQRFCQ